MTTQRTRMDFPDAVEQPVQRRKSEVDRLIEALEVGQRRSDAEQAKQTNLLRFMAGWVMVCGFTTAAATFVGAGAFVAFVWIWWLSRHSDPDSPLATVLQGGFIAIGALIVLTLLIVLGVSGVRRAVFRMLKIKD